MGHGFVWARCPSVADVDCAGHFGGSGIPRVERPHRAFVVIVDPAAHQFGDRGQLACGCGGLIPGGVLDRGDELGIGGRRKRGIALDV